MRDPYFERTVVLLVHHDEDGALGLVVNREGNVSVSAVIARMDIGDAPARDVATWWGGPVAPSAGFVLWRGQADPAEGWNPGPDVAVSPSAERLAALARAGERYFLALGHAGWSAAQLDEEIQRGSWLVADLDARILFETPLAERYDRALAQLGLTPSSVWMQPVDE
jgi:putative transcriptional regulator